MNFDVDVDVSPSFKRFLEGHSKEYHIVRASVYNDDKKRMVPHPSGYYFDSDVFVDSLTGNASFDYEDGEEFFQKIDILNNSIYQNFSSKKEMMEVLNMETDWDLLLDESFVYKLPHIGTHFSLIEQLRPRDVHDLADVLALMRPGKLHLVESYVRQKKSTRRQLYTRPVNGKHYFKKSHSYAYAMSIILMMNFYQKEKDKRMSALGIKD